MSFMEMQITHKVDGYEIDTEDGIVYLPEFVCGYWNAVLDSGREFFGQYTERGPDSINAVTKVHGYFGRYSAAGYMDCTAYSFGQNARKLARELREMYG